MLLAKDLRNVRSEHDDINADCDNLVNMFSGVLDHHTPYYSNTSRKGGSSCKSWDTYLAVAAGEL